MRCRSGTNRKKRERKKTGFASNMGSLGLALLCRNKQVKQQHKDLRSRVHLLLSNFANLIYNSALDRTLIDEAITAYSDIQSDSTCICCCLLR